MVSKTKVVNIRANVPYDVYIGRGSKWGNPFTHLKGKTKADFLVNTRQESVTAYAKWIQSQPELLKDLPELKGKTLGCYCKPAFCHGDILAELADNLK